MYLWIYYIYKYIFNYKSKMQEKYMAASYIVVYIFLLQKFFDCSTIK